MLKKSASINLVKKPKSESLEKAIDWSLGIGRILVIVTELVAFIAFLYRFSLDQQIVDLHTEIKQKQAIVSTFKKNEDEYRNLQERLSIASNFSVATEKKQKIYEDIINFAPSGLVFNQLSLTENRISMEININSVLPLSNFIDSLKSYPAIESISIDKIESRTASAVITVGVSAVLKPIPNQYAIKNN